MEGNADYFRDSLVYNRLSFKNFIRYFSKMCVFHFKRLRLTSHGRYIVLFVASDSIR